MKRQIYVSVSLDPAREYHKALDYAKSLQGDADFMHCDVMDGQFVKDKNFDPGICNNINQNCLTMLDVHLMCQEPLYIIDDYLQAGANIVTIHYEAFENKNDIVEAARKIKEASALAGISIKPQTKLQDVKLYLHDFDVVLVMSVEPGQSGQKFMPSALEKIRELNKLREHNGYKFKIEVDGGVNGDNAQEIISAGADILVSGAYIYNSSDKGQAIASLKR